MNKAYMASNDSKLSKLNMGNSIPWTDAAPAYAEYNENLYIVYKGYSDKVICCSCFDGICWTGNQRIATENSIPWTDTAPALAVYNGKLYLAYKGYGDKSIFFSWFDGNCWSGNWQINTGNSVPWTDTAPALAVYNGKLYLAYKGYNDKVICYSWFDGNSWSGNQQIKTGNSVPWTDAAPALAVYNGKLYLAYKGYNNRVICYSWFDGNNWSGNQQIKTGNSVPWTDEAPALVVYNSRLYITYKGYKDKVICYSLFDGNNWSGNQQIKTANSVPWTDTAPALAAHNGWLYLAYKGYHDKVICCSWFDGNNWFGNVQANVERVGYPCWMEDLQSDIANCKLKDLIIPGTHDSGTYGVSALSTIAPSQDVSEWVNCVYGLGPLAGLTVMGVIANWAKTQGQTIIQQLEAGIRYLDLRVVLSGNEYYICHSLYSINIDELITQVSDFIKSHPKEILILDFNHLYEMNTLEQNIPLIEKLIKAFGSKIAPKDMSPNSMISDFWQSGYQIIILYGNNETVASYPQLWYQTNISSRWPETTSMSDLKNKLSDYLSSREADKLFVLQGILTPDTTMIGNSLIPFTEYAKTLETIAKDATPKVTVWLNEWANQAMNIVIVDWFDSANYVETILNLNIQKYGT